MSVLELKHVTKQFGGLTAVSDLSLALAAGGIHGLIGPNGAGKTTVFNLITGMYTPSSGEIWLDGKRIDGLKPNQITSLGCARTFQNLRLFKRLTVLENITIASQLHLANYTYLDTILKTRKYREQEKAAYDHAKELIDVVGLSDYQNECATNLPYGYQRKMEIARAVATSPKVLLLDEPAAGMNPDESYELMELIDSVRKQFHLSILLIEHHMELVMGICEQITVLNFGEEIASGTPEQVQSNPEVIRAYLGGEVIDHDA